MAIARHFDGHPKVSAVLYLGLPSAAGHAIAAPQMVGGSGGIVSMRSTGSETAAIASAEQVEVFKGRPRLPTSNPRGGAKASSMCSAIWETRDSIPRH
jgi:cystathionine beta-lyase/cystathionine gamma-synthase